MEETQDIVAWLRDREAFGRNIGDRRSIETSDNLKRAADEIERLRSEREAICAALDIEPTDDPVEAIKDRVAKAAIADEAAEAIGVKVDDVVGQIEVERVWASAMEEIGDVCGHGRCDRTPTKDCLAAMIFSMEAVTVSDEDALTAWRKWAVEMAGIDEDDTQGLEDETLRIAAADRWEGEAQVWKDAHGHADAAAKASGAQRDFYRTRLHAEIEAHSLRAAKEKT